MGKDRYVVKRQLPGKIAEVKIGATKSEGGSRNSVVVVGGDTCLPFSGFCENKNPPVISLDIFDMKIPLPRAIREYYEDAMEDPAEWARVAVKKYGAVMVNLHLVSTDPSIKDTSPEEAAKTVEEVLQAVKVPLFIGGSGNPEKDPKVFAKVAEVAQGERCLLASATLEAYKTIAASALAYGHNVVAWTNLDVNQAKQLNRLLTGMGLTPDRIVMDPTTGALGYGLEYTFSVVERMKIQALVEDDKELQMPILVAASNAWGAREAWRKEKAWGPRECRGPLWEAVTAVTGLMAGVNLILMVHPYAAQVVRECIELLRGGKPPESPLSLVRRVVDG